MTLLFLAAPLAASQIVSLPSILLTSQFVESQKPHALLSSWRASVVASILLSALLSVFMLSGAIMACVGLLTSPSSVGSGLLLATSLVEVT